MNGRQEIAWARDGRSAVLWIDGQRADDYRILELTAPELAAMLAEAEAIGRRQGRAERPRIVRFLARFGLA